MSEVRTPVTMAIKRKLQSSSFALSIINGLAKLPMLTATTGHIEADPKTLTDVRKNEELESLVIIVGIATIVGMLVFFIIANREPDYKRANKTRSTALTFSFVSSTFQSASHGYLQTSTPYTERFKDRIFVSRSILTTLLGVLQAVLFLAFGMSLFMEENRREKKMQATADAAGEEKAKQSAQFQANMAAVFSFVAVLIIFVFLVLLTSIAMSIFASIQVIFGSILCICELLQALLSLMLLLDISKIQNELDREKHLEKQRKSTPDGSEEELNIAKKEREITPIYTTREEFEGKGDE